MERRLSVRVVVLWNLLVEESALAAIIGRLRLMEELFNGKRFAWRDSVTGTIRNESSRSERSGVT